MVPESAQQGLQYPLWTCWLNIKAVCAIYIISAYVEKSRKSPMLLTLVVAHAMLCLRTTGQAGPESTYMAVS